MPTPTVPICDQSIEIAAPADFILEAFFDAHALSCWWHCVRSVTAARPLGIYAVEWETTPFSDDLLGVLGGHFYGTVMDYRAGDAFFLAEVYWLPPESEPVGPMALHVTCVSFDRDTRVRVVQSGFEESPRWRRYYELMEQGWASSLKELKKYCEQDKAGRLWGRWGRLSAEERRAKEDDDASSKLKFPSVQRSK